MIRFSDMTKKLMLPGMALPLLAGLCFYATPALAADAVNGKILHDAKCFGCHDNRQYTRKNRIIHSFEDLHSRVEFCDANLNAGFSFGDLDDVVVYLNTEFYKFKE